MADPVSISGMTRDALRPSRDLGELRALKGRRPPPLDATPHNAADTSRRAKVLVPWLYDVDYGWTPRREGAEPRPLLNLPSYFGGDFPLSTCGLKNGKHYFIAIDLRPFPEQARVFVEVPQKMLGGLAPVPGPRKGGFGSNVAVVKRIDDFNRLCGQRRRAPVARGTVVLELARGKRAILNNLSLSQEPQTIHVYYAVLREDVRPKTYYTMQLAQFIDHRLVGTFHHVLNAHHNYDVPVIGDRRTKTAYRRSSREVSAIPPLALAFFASWKEAQAAGYDFSPRSFGKHYRADDVTVALADEVLAFFNKAGTTAEKIVATVVDNPHVNAFGGEEPAPVAKRGIDLKTAQRIISSRQKLPKKRFARLQEIDAVPGVGADTMSDVLTSILGLRKPAPIKGRGRWEPDPGVVALLRRR